MADLSPDIQKLAEKVQKDPTSRLFFPLAEEYMKSGLFEEAVLVLTEGLKRHPDYLSARVALGKAYFEQGKRDEARHEFEGVLTLNPDNLLAMRKLAVIYLQVGRLDEARRYCTTLLTGNPKDVEMQQLLRQIDGAESAAPTAPPPETGDKGAEDAVEPASLLETSASQAASAAGAISSSPGEFAAEPLLDSHLHEKPAAGAPPGGATEEEEKTDTSLGSPTLAKLYLEQGHYEQAVRIYDELLRRDPQNESLLQARRMAMALQEGQEEAAPAPAASEDATGGRERVLTRLEQWLSTIERHRAS